MSHRGTGKLFNRVVTETSAHLATVEEQLHGCAVRVQKQRSSLQHHNTQMSENTQLKLRFKPLTCLLLHKCPFLWKKAEKKQIIKQLQSFEASLEKCETTHHLRWSHCTWGKKDISKISRQMANNDKNIRITTIHGEDKI